MYLRNVKQILRAGDFDERRYGFGGLIDLLRACMREGYVRLERDRRGAQDAELHHPVDRRALLDAAVELRLVDDVLDHPLGLVAARAAGAQDFDHAHGSAHGSSSNHEFNPKIRVATK